MKLIRFRYIVIFLLITFPASISIFAQKNHSINNLIPSDYNPSLFEINEIIFTGNHSIPSGTLSNIIFSRITDKSVFHKVLYYYFQNVNQNRSAPPILKTTLRNIVLSMSEEVYFYDETRVETDRMNIAHYYYQNGFHEVKVGYHFYPNKKRTGNSLEFTITEGPRYYIDFFKVEGLDFLPEEIQKKINSIWTTKVGQPFNEINLVQELNQIRLLLRENGYFYAEFRTPLVILDTIRKIDSIWVQFQTGKRQRIGKITFVDSVDNQKRVGYNVKFNQLDLKPGDVFSLKKLLSSEINLNTLGTFELVRIDTSSKVAPFNDTTINLAVFLRYRKQEDFGVGLFTNRTTVEKAINVGFDAQYSHRNIFGGAQSVNLFARISAVDVSRWLIEKKQLEYEIQSGIIFNQPVLWIIGNSRVALSSQLLFSYRKVYNLLRLLTFSFPVRFSTKLPVWTFFNFMDIDFFFERQVPLNYDEVAKDFLRDAKIREDTIRILEAISIFDNLDKYLRKNKLPFTSTLFGINLSGDTRDNPLLPHKGMLFNLSLDGDLFLGVAQFHRLSLTNLLFRNLGRFTVLATKIRVGHIFWRNKGTSIVPFERQFFAGGANSVRGWPSRQLRYYKGARNDTSRSDAVNSFLRDFVGNASIIESSVELRFRLGKPSYIGSPFADIIDNLRITTFFDVGNAFQWLVLDEKGDYVTKYKLSDYLTGLAAAIGFGVGFITPAGPLCLDFGFPIYDPNKEKKPFGGVVFHIRLGYAF